MASTGDLESDSNVSLLAALFNQGQTTISGLWADITTLLAEIKDLLSAVDRKDQAICYLDAKIKTAVFEQAVEIEKMKMQHAAEITKIKKAHDDELTMIEKSNDDFCKKLIAREHHAIDAYLAAAAERDELIIKYNGHLAMFTKHLEEDELLITHGPAALAHCRAELEKEREKNLAHEAELKALKDKSS